MSEWKLVNIKASYAKEGSDALLHVEWDGEDVVGATDHTPIKQEEFDKIVADFRTRMASQNISVA